MSNIILYPTETLYALGVHATDPKALDVLYTLKGRDASKVSSWLVRDIADIRRYAVLGERGAKLAEGFLPGKLTLVLPIKPELFSGSDPELSKDVVAPDGTIGFRISSDPVAQKLVADFMEAHNAPLTCTSANVSGAPAFPTVGEILQQFGKKAEMITDVIDDGPRKGLASTVVRVRDDEVTVIREGEISEQDILDALQ